MGAVAADHEPRPRDHRRRAGGASGDPALSLLDLHAGPAAHRLLRAAADHGLGLGPHDRGAAAAPWPGRREPRLARGLPAGAGERRLLSGLGAAAMAAISGM